MNTMISGVMIEWRWQRWPGVDDDGSFATRVVRTIDMLLNLIRNETSDMKSFLPVVTVYLPGFNVVSKWFLSLSDDRRRKRGSASASRAVGGCPTSSTSSVSIILFPLTPLLSLTGGAIIVVSVVTRIRWWTYLSNLCYNAGRLRFGPHPRKSV